MSEYLSVANAPWLWLAAVPVALIVILQALIFSWRAKKTAPLVDLSLEDAHKAFRVGMTSAIGPSLGVFVVMLGLMGVIGAPLSWMRLSVIGAAPTELAAAEMAAKAQGMTLSSSGYSLINFANATWVMALNGSAWLLTSGLFSDKLDGMTRRISKGDPVKLAILMVSAMCGAFGYLFANQVMLGLKTKQLPIVVAAVGAAVSMVLLERVAKKWPKLKEYNLGISMAFAMALAVVFKHIVGA